MPRSTASQCALASSFSSGDISDSPNNLRRSERLRRRTQVQHWRRSAAPSPPSTREISLYYQIENNDVSLKAETPVHVSSASVKQAPQIPLTETSQLVDTSSIVSNQAPQTPVNERLQGVDSSLTARKQAPQPALTERPQGIDASSIVSKQAPQSPVAERLQGVDTTLTARKQVHQTTLTERTQGVDASSTARKRASQNTLIEKLQSVDHLSTARKQAPQITLPEGSSTTAKQAPQIPLPERPRGVAIPPIGEALIGHVVPGQVIPFRDLNGRFNQAELREIAQARLAVPQKRKAPGDDNPDTTAAMPQYIVTPWREHSELLQVCRQLFRREEFAPPVDHRRHAVDWVAAWKIRGNLPHAIESTSHLVEAVLLHEADVTSQFSIRATYSSAFCRFVTGFCDVYTTGTKRKVSMLEVARELHMPASFVELRHEATHGDLPSLPRLAMNTQLALAWLWQHYWIKLDRNEDDAEKPPAKRRRIALPESDNTVVSAQALQIAPTELDNTIMSARELQIAPLEPDNTVVSAQELRIPPLEPDNTVASAREFQIAPLEPDNMAVSTQESQTALLESEDNVLWTQELRVALTTFLSQRKDEIKARSIDLSEDSASGTAAQALLTLCVGRKKGLTILVETLMEEKMLIPAARTYALSSFFNPSTFTTISGSLTKLPSRLGESMNGAFIIWGNVLRRVTLYQADFLPTLMKQMLSMLTQPSHLAVELDERREAVYRWVMDILTGKAWQHPDLQDRFEGLRGLVVNECIMAPNCWTGLLARDLVIEGDEEFQKMWMPLVALMDKC